jgi:hypothetical protein
MQTDLDARARGPTRSRSWAAVPLIVLLLVVPGSAELLQHGDGKADGRKSLGGSGHLVLFDADKDGRWLNRVEMFGSRYGLPAPPDEDFHLYIVDGQKRLLRDVALPYSLWERGGDYWRDLPIPPVQVPKEFGIGLNFSPHQTKGVYVGTEEVLDSHSYSWLPGQPAQVMVGVDWMVRATVDEAPAGDPAARDLVLLRGGQSCFFDRVQSASGDPLTLETAAHGTLPMNDVASVRLGAATSPQKTTATVVLQGGMKIEGEVLSVDANTVRVRDASGAERDLPRVDVARIDFSAKE